MFILRYAAHGCVRKLAKEGKARDYIGMRLHLVTVGAPKLQYAKLGWEEYFNRLKRYHVIRVTHVPDKKAYDATHLLAVAGGAYKIALVIDGTQFTSPEFAAFLEKKAIDAREVCLMVGGPEGLPDAVIAAADFKLGLSRLTLPHDLAMVVLLEALYRAGTISAGISYHK
jgi:23S rRNA (pseudouridine1915-N3)-methyltransferase